MTLWGSVGLFITMFTLFLRFLPMVSITEMRELLPFRQGDRLLPRLVRYVDERRAQQDRWTQGLASFPGPMTVLWGEQDPSAVVAIARHLGAIRPATEVITWPDVGHWPHYEVPQRVADHILGRVAAHA